MRATWFSLPQGGFGLKRERANQIDVKTKMLKNIQTMHSAAKVAETRLIRPDGFYQACDET